MITRTFVTTTANCMVVGVADNTVKEVARIIPEKVDAATAEKYFRKNWNLPDMIFVRVNSIEHTEKIFGMSEETFLKYAVALDDKRKPIK